jgi:S-adenosylmethionine uptake transporter
MPGWNLVRIVLIVVNSVIVSYTFTKLPIAQAYAIFFCMPLLITILAVPFLGESLDLPRVLAIIVGFSGVLIALRPGSEALQFAHLTAIAGATFGALNSLILRKISDKERAAVMLLYPTLAQVVIMGALLPWIWQPMDAFTWGLGAMIGVLSVIGGVMIITAYGRAPAIVVAPMQYSQIIWGALGGALIFGERMDALMILGIAIIIAAGLFLLWRSGQPAAGPADYSQKS